MICRKWAESPEYHEPVDFKTMQKGGREREDGTIIISKTLCGGEVVLTTRHSVKL